MPHAYPATAIVRVSIHKSSLGIIGVWRSNDQALSSRGRSVNLLFVSCQVSLTDVANLLIGG